MRVTKDPEIRRQELIDTGLKLFMDKGYDKTSVKDIVTEVGVAQGLFYYYFPSKEDMLKAIAEHYVEVLKSRFQAAGMDDCDDPVFAVKLLLETAFRFLEDNEHLIECMHKPTNTQLHDTITYALIREAADIIAEIITLGNEKGVFNCKFPEKMAKTFTYGILLAVHEETDFIMMNLGAEKEFVLYAISVMLNIDEEKLRMIL